MPDAEYRAMLAHLIADARAGKWRGRKTSFALPSGRVSCDHDITILGLWERMGHARTMPQEAVACASPIPQAKPLTWGQVASECETDLRFLVTTFHTYLVGRRDPAPAPRLVPPPGPRSKASAGGRAR